MDVCYCYINGESFIPTLGFFMISILVSICLQNHLKRSFVNLMIRLFWNTENNSV